VDLAGVLDGGARDLAALADLDPDRVAVLVVDVERVAVDARDLADRRVGLLLLAPKSSRRNRLRVSGDGLSLGEGVVRISVP